MLPRVSYWLIPTDLDRAPLAQAIQHLAARANGPVFEPHVTLYSGPADSTEHIERILAAAAGVTPAILLTSTGLAHSEQFTKTLFAEFAPHDALVSMAARLKQLSAHWEDYELNPHLSLLYANLDHAQRETLARSVMVPKVIRFDALKAVLTGASTSSRADVEAWRVLREKALG